MCSGHRHGSEYLMRECITVRCRWRRKAKGRRWTELWAPLANGHQSGFQEVRPGEGRFRILSMEHWRLEHHCCVVVVVHRQQAEVARYVSLPSLNHTPSNSEYRVHMDISTWLLLVFMVPFCGIGDGITTVLFICAPSHGWSLVLIRGSLLLS